MRILGGISRKKHAMYFLLFTVASFVFSSLAYYIPFGYGIRLSLTSYDAISKPIFIGFDNFKELFQDPVFWVSTKNSFIYALYVVPTIVILSFLIATGLNKETRLIMFLRVLYFLPMVTSSIAVSLVWKWIFHRDYGILNRIMEFFHLPRQDWLGDPKLALLSVAIVGIWGGLSYNIILFLAGLQNIPKTYYEAAMIDGATKKDMLFYITVPLMSPITFFVLVTTTIWSVQVFDTVFIMTSGGPGYATYTLVYYIYRNGFFWFRMGYGMAIAWVLYGFLLILTIIQFALQRKWVYYE